MILGRLPDAGRSGWHHFIELYRPDTNDVLPVDGILEQTFVDVEASLAEATQNGPETLMVAIRHLTTHGGKRLRPALVALGGTLVHDHVAAKLRPVAAAAEMLHTATLLHDDVLDEGDLRRGKPAVRVLWGNCMSVLGGNFVLVQALRRICGTDTRLLDTTFDVLDQMIAAEVLQLEMRQTLRFDPDLSRQVILGKTASLFAWCASAAARMAERPDFIDALDRYGRHLGMAFQIVDDLRDLIEQDPVHASKTILGDLHAGTVSLPIALAATVSPSLADLLRTVAASSHVAHPDAIIAHIRRTDALAHAADEAEKAVQHAHHAIRTLPQTHATHLLDSLAEILIQPVIQVVRQNT